jgi:hypothetical protein
MNLDTNVPPSLTDVSPGIDTFPWSGGHSVSGRMHALALPSDALRLYAGSHAGVWRSDDAGVSSWLQPQLTRAADEWSFLLWQFGVPAYQPVKSALGE